MALNPNLHSTRSFFAFSPDLMACLNPEGFFQEVNPAWEKSLGFLTEALIGESFLNLVFSEDRPKAVLEIQRLSRGRQETVSFETRIQDTQKKYHDIAWTCQADPASESWVLIGRDMTEFRSLQRAFSESLERFEKFSDSSAEGLAIHDRGVILEANQALARMFGFERASDLIGKNGLELTDAAGRETIQQRMRDHWERPYEVTGQRRDGTTFPCQLRGREISYRGKSARVSTFLDLTDLRGREKEIAQSEEKFRCLSEAATEGVAITWQGKVLELNRALAGLLGYEPSEMVGRSVLEFTAPDSRERVTQMTLSEREEVFEAVALHQNGTRLPFQISSHSVSFRGDRVRVSVFKPLANRSGKEFVSSLKNNPSDEWIRGSDGAFGKIFEEAFFGMALVDLNPCRFRQILRINPVFQKMLGYSEKDLVGKTMTDFCHPEDVPVEGGSLGRILDGESRREEMDKRYIRSDGTVVWVHVILIVIRGPQGEPLFGLAMAQDITQQREAEAARDRSESRLRAVFNSSSQSLAVLDRQGLLEAFNPQAAVLMKKIVGVAPVVGQSLGGTLAEPMLGFFSENFRKALQEGTQISERQLEDLDGESHWYEFQYYPVLDEQGKTTAVCLTTTLIDDRKKAEDSLRESEERFRRIFEDTSVGMTLVAQDKRFLHVNRAFCEMLGYNEEELKTKTFRDITHPDDIEQNILLGLGIDEGRGFRMQKRYRRKDGGVVWVNLTVTAFHNEKGEFQHSLGIVENITEQKRVEEGIRESEDRYRRLVEFSPEAIFVFVNEKITYANPAGVKLMGAAHPEELVGYSVLAMGAPEERVTMKLRLEQVLRNQEENPPLEQKFTRLNGQILDVEAQSTFFNYLGRPAGLMVVRDITQRKKAVQAFQDSQESYRRLVEFFPETVMVHSEEKLLYINPPGLKMFGATEPGEMLGRSVYDFVSTPFLEAARLRVDDIYNNKLFSHPMDQVWLKLDGTPLEVEIRGTFFSFMGKPSILSILRDVSERNRTQRMLLRYERLAAVGQVIAGIAHDIRNPLAVLSSMTLSLRDKFSGLETGSKEVEVISSQTDRLKRLMNDILDYAKGLTLVKTRIEPQPFLEQCLQLVQTQLGTARPKVEVKWDFRGPLTPFTADQERLEQVLLNLILNAYEALDQGGTLTLSFESTDQEVLLRVQDDGCGIPASALAQLFEPFTTTKKYGSGLGLSVSRKIVEAHGGQIEVEWIEPHGTLFTVRIPQDRR